VFLSSWGEDQGEGDSRRPALAAGSVEAAMPPHPTSPQGERRSGGDRTISGQLAEIPTDIAPRIVFHRRVGSRLVVAGIDAALVVLDDALVGLAGDLPQPGQLLDIVIDALACIAAHQ